MPSRAKIARKSLRWIAGGAAGVFAASGLVLHLATPERSDCESRQAKLLANTAYSAVPERAEFAAQRFCEAHRGTVAAKPLLNDS